MMMMIVLHVVGGYHRSYNEKAFYVTLKNMFYVFIIGLTILSLDLRYFNLSSCLCY